MMSSLSHSTAIIPYSPPICPSEFIKQEVEKNFHSNLLKKKVILFIPSPKPYDEKSRRNLFSTIQGIYSLCSKQSFELQGAPFFSQKIDLSKKEISILTSKNIFEKIDQIIITSHVIGELCASLKLDFKIDQRVETFIIPRSPIHITSEFFKGSEWERVFFHTAFQTVDRAFWGNWETQMAHEAQFYETTIYPQILKTIQKFCLMSKTKHFEIIDMGGGSGRLSAKIAE